MRDVSCDCPKSGDEVTVFCLECRIDIDSNTQARNCDMCRSSEAWKCAKCFGISDALYSALKLAPDEILHFFCDECKKRMFELENKQDSDMLKIMELLIDQVTRIEKKLEEKVDRAAVAEK